MPTLAYKDTAIKAATYAGTGNETQYRVEGHPGLVLSVLPGPERGASGGRRTWRYFYATGERRLVRKITLGTYPATSLAKAAAAASALALRVAEEGDIVAIDGAAEKAQTAAAEQQRVHATRRGLTFADLLDEYVADRQDLLRIQETARELRKDALPALRSKHPNDVTAADIDTIAAAIKNRGSATMAHRIIMLIKALYNYCLLDRPALAQKYGLTHNPADKLGRRRHGTSAVYPPPAARTRVLENTEITSWWRALDQSATDARTRIGLKLVLATGQRPGRVARRGGLATGTGRGTQDDGAFSGRVDPDCRGSHVVERARADAHFRHGRSD